MTRFCTVILLCAVAFSGLRAEPPVGKTPASLRDEAALKETLLAQKYRDFEASLLALAQRLERSGKPQDLAQAATVRRALEAASKGAIATRFDRLNATLKNTDVSRLEEVKEAIQNGEQLLRDLREVLEVLLRDGNLDRTKVRIKRLAELIRMLNAAIRDQKVVRIHTENNRMGKDELVKGQQQVASKTDELARIVEKGEGEPLPGKNLIRGANDDQREAGRNLVDGRNEQASGKQSAAIDKLVKVRDALEKLLQQLRIDELKEMLASLRARCELMLQMQTAVNEGTTQLDGEIVQFQDRRPKRVQEQKSLALADRENAVLREADKAILLLKDEGSAVAFTEVFSQLRDDTAVVERRLGKADTGALTQQIESDIVATLREMIEALKKAQQPPQPGTGGGGGPSKLPKQAKEPRLLDTVAELKLIRSMQVRVNERTKSYGKLYRGEQAEVPAICDELKNIADRQLKIYQVTVGTDRRVKEEDE